MSGAIHCILTFIPFEIAERIIGYLDFASLLTLRRVSRFYNNRIFQWSPSQFKSFNTLKSFSKFLEGNPHGLEPTSFKLTIPSPLAVSEQGRRLEPFNTPERMLLPSLSTKQEYCLILIKEDTSDIRGRFLLSWNCQEREWRNRPFLLPYRRHALMIRSQYDMALPIDSAVKLIDYEYESFTIRNPLGSSEEDLHSQTNGENILMTIADISSARDDRVEWIYRSLQDSLEWTRITDIPIHSTANDHFTMDEKMDSLGPHYWILRRRSSKKKDKDGVHLVDLIGYEPKKWIHQPQHGIISAYVSAVIDRWQLLINHVQNKYIRI